MEANVQRDYQPLFYLVQPLHTEMPDRGAFTVYTATHTMFLACCKDSAKSCINFSCTFSHIWWHSGSNAKLGSCTYFFCTRTISLAIFFSESSQQDSYYGLFSFIHWHPTSVEFWWFQHGSGSWSRQWHLHETSQHLQVHDVCKLSKEALDDYFPLTRDPSG